MSKKEPWGEGTPWANSTAFFTYLRGCLRKAWSHHPVKLNLIKKQRKQVPNVNPKGNKPTVWGFDCVLCDKTFPIKEGNVDHITPAGSLKKTEDIQGFVERLLYVTEDDLRLICKTCNSTLAYADKQGVSFQEASLQKLAIDLTKKGMDKAWLESKGIVPCGNATKRREQILTKLREEMDNAT